MSFEKIVFLICSNKKGKKEIEMMNVNRIEQCAEYTKVTAI